ncbi:MAG: DUF4435 domain-containing protein [Proteobacteria bacterium]|nr:DUF4435 domain-containing protein [Pseudomonadota bacterium]
MMHVKPGIRPEEVKLQGQHVLFVEGNDNDSADPKVLEELFEHKIGIKPLGPSYSVQSVAAALFKHHPTYYFLIDRDHHKDEFVTKCWENFPDPATHNLLVWRRREVENYFLEPDYLCQSQYCCVSQDELGQKILKFANERLFLDVTNHVVISIREELKKNWIEKFKDLTGFSCKATALRKLKDANEFNQHQENVTQKVSGDEVERRFHEHLENMMGGQERLMVGVGDWLHMIQGKKVLAQIIHSDCFRVHANDGKPVAGREKLNAVVKDLLQKDLSVQPEDFRELKQLIEKRISEV